jgi:hypothetical protein
MTDENELGIELAKDRPLFPTLALRLMHERSTPHNEWAVPPERDLHAEPLLVKLWRQGTKELVEFDDSAEPRWWVDMFLDGVDGAVEALAWVARAAFDLQDAYLDDLEEMEKANSLTLGSGWSLSNARLDLRLISLLGSLVIDVQVQFLGGETPDPETSTPEVETEASWHAKAKAAGLTWDEEAKSYFPPSKQVG